MHESFDMLNQTKIENKNLSAINSAIASTVQLELKSLEPLIKNKNLLPGILCNKKFNIISNLVKEMACEMQEVAICKMANYFGDNWCQLFHDQFTQSINIISAMVKQFGILIRQSLMTSDIIIFLQIARKLGFPIYLEINSDLKDKLVASYKKNNNEYNILEMQNIILDYYNDGYVKGVLNKIQNVNLYNRGRVSLIEEGLEIYLKGYYGGSSSIFATQLSGMILDVYNLLNSIYSYSNKEREKLLFQFRQGGRTDSEKSMLLQVICRQKGGSMLWYAVLRYFFDVIYSSKDTDMDTQPKRHKICHGIQTNINTKIMSLKLIMCMDIITELGWRVENMKAESEIICEM